MRALVVEDDPTSALLLQEFLKGFGPVQLVADGNAAVDAVGIAIWAGEPYDLICLDIMLPELDGIGVLKEIRDMEKDAGTATAKWSKVIMTTALRDPKTVSAAGRGLCDAYLTKPIRKDELMDRLRTLQLIP
jgi:two-component system chemotaxis response regulator CheY